MTPATFIPLKVRSSGGFCVYCNEHLTLRKKNGEFFCVAPRMLGSKHYLPPPFFLESAGVVGWYWKGWGEQQQNVAFVSLSKGRQFSTCFTKQMAYSSHFERFWHVIRYAIHDCLVNRMISMQISFWNGIQFEQPKIETRICSFLQDVSILIVILIWKKKILPWTRGAS